MFHLVVLFLGALVSFAATPDLFIFDEDDPLGVNYYDASVGYFTPPSSLRLAAMSLDKMPIVTNEAASGKISGLIEWTSTTGGDWAMRIFRPGFPLLNATRYHSLVFSLNAPRSIDALSLPTIQLEDLWGQKAVSPLIISLPGGIDANRDTWQSVTIPISSFEVQAGFNPAAVKRITFRQRRSDDNPAAIPGALDGPHVLWIDQLHFRAADRLLSTHRPPHPSNLVARAGDRSITLHWDAVTDPNLSGYHIFRAESENGAYTEIPGSPVQIQSIADTGVENDRPYFYQVKASNELGLGPASQSIRVVPRAFKNDDDFLEYVQVTSFDYFWYEADPVTGLVRDRSQPWSAASVAAAGFGLTAMGIGIDRGWITREIGRERTLRTLRTLWQTPQGSGFTETSGFRGWFYHFLEPSTGLRFGTSELSSIDTALLLAGVLYSIEYFRTDHPLEVEIRSLGRQILERVDWNWMLNSGNTLSMGWHPERGFINARWRGYNEASILYFIGLGAVGSNRLSPLHWTEWTRTYGWNSSFGFDYVQFAPLFGHQYSACWVDFRGTADEYMRAKGITYFENSRRAVLAQRQYAIENPGRFPGYSSDIWGFTACDGPGSNLAHGYIARGAPPAEYDDGTIAPTAPGGSVPFAPAECIAALRQMYERYREKIWCGYGFRDAFNVRDDWWGADVIGIDQGPILVMIENYRCGRVWEVMRQSEVLARGMQQAGFRPFPAKTPLRN